MPLEGVTLGDLFTGVHGTGPAGEHEVLAKGRVVVDSVRALSQDRPTVLAIDDAQWLDQVSARSLRFALRRLTDVPVVILATFRTDIQVDDPLALDDTVPPERREEILLGPMHMDADPGRPRQHRPRGLEADPAHDHRGVGRQSRLCGRARPVPNGARLRARTCGASPAGIAPGGRRPTARRCSSGADTGPRAGRHPRPSHAGRSRRVARRGRARRAGSTHRAGRALGSPRGRAGPDDPLRAPLDQIRRLRPHGAGLASRAARAPRPRDAATTTNERATSPSRPTSPMPRWRISWKLRPRERRRGALTISPRSSRGTRGGSRRRTGHRMPIAGRCRRSSISRRQAR